jgi:hypothetical protein
MNPYIDHHYVSLVPCTFLHTSPFTIPTGYMPYPYYGTYMGYGYPSYGMGYYHHYHPHHHHHHPHHMAHYTGGTTGPMFAVPLQATVRWQNAEPQTY